MPMRLKSELYKKDQEDVIEKNYIHIRFNQ